MYRTARGATYQWYIDNEKAGTDKDQVFTKTETGDYQVKLVATNEDGTTEYETIVRVEESPTLRIETTDPVSHIKSAPRTVMEGRSVFLKPIIVNAVDPTYSWSVDDIEQEGVTTPYFNFTPAEQKGIHGKIDRYQSYATGPVPCFPRILPKAKAIPHPQRSR